MKRSLAQVLSIALLGIAAVLLGSTPALAHSELVSSDPADGAVLDAPPTQVTLTFNEDLLPDFVSVVGTSPDGETLDLPVSGVDGPTAVVDWPLGAPGGQWQVTYRVVSQDGHPVEGAISFAYDAPAPSPTSPSPSSASPTTAAPTTAAPTTTAPTSPSPTTAAPTVEPSPEPSPASDATAVSGGVIAIAVLGVLAVVAVVAIIVVRRRSSEQ